MAPNSGVTPHHELMNLTGLGPESGVTLQHELKNLAGLGPESGVTPQHILVIYWKLETRKGKAGRGGTL